MEIIDIKQIMQEIRQEALERIPEPEELPDVLNLFASLSSGGMVFDQAEYASNLLLLNRYWQVPLDRPLVRSGGIKGILKMVYHRVSRKLMRWYIAPVIQEMNENSARNLQLHNQISRFIETQQIEIERLKVILASLQKDGKHNTLPNSNRSEKE